MPQSRTEVSFFAHDHHLLAPVVVRAKTSSTPSFVYLCLSQVIRSPSGTPLSLTYGFPPQLGKPVFDG